MKTFGEEYLPELTAKEAELVRSLRRLRILRVLRIPALAVLLPVSLFLLLWLMKFFGPVFGLMLFGLYVYLVGSLLEHFLTDNYKAEIGYAKYQLQRTRSFIGEIRSGKEIPLDRYMVQAHCYEDFL